MPTLDFKGKSFVFTHHLSVPFRELVIDAKKSEVPKGKPSLDDNLIAVLEFPPVDSAQKAGQVQIVNDVKGIK